MLDMISPDNLNTANCKQLNIPIAIMSCIHPPSPFQQTHSFFLRCTVILRQTLLVLAFVCWWGIVAKRCWNAPANTIIPNLVLDTEPGSGFLIGSFMNWWQSMAGLDWVKCVTETLDLRCRCFCCCLFTFHTPDRNENRQPTYFFLLRFQFSRNWGFFFHSALTTLEESHFSEPY